MVVKRISTSAWAALAFVAVVDVTACDGESTTSSHDDGGGTSGSDGNGGTGDRGGASGTGGSTGGRGGTAARGGSPTGGSSGDAGAGATSGDAGEAGTAGQGGVAGDAGGGGDAGAGDGGLAGDAGGGPVDMTVQGHLVDFWRAPLANVPVTIGTTTVVTDANGSFSVDSVPPVYDVKLVSSWTGPLAGVYGWYFEGLTRRDPTLQIYKGRSNRNANVQFTPQNANVDTTRRLSFALGTASGSNHFSSGASGVISGANWVGPSSTLGTAYGLLWAIDASDLPTGYHAYSSTTATLVDGGPQVVFTLDMSDSSIASAPVSGTITSHSSDDRSNYLFLRHPGGVATEIVEDYPPPDTYSYLAPTIATTSLVVAASTGFSSTAYSIAHRDGIAAGQTGVALTIPAPAAPVLPANGFAGVNTSTQFSWSGGTGAVVFHVEDVDRYQGLFVVTNRRAITLPTFDGFALRANAAHRWTVETHGNVASVDQFASPEGGLDSFSGRLDMPEGPKTTDGSYSHSAPRGFTTAP